MKKIAFRLIIFLLKKFLIISIKNNKSEPLFSTKILNMINHNLGKGSAGPKSIDYEIKVVKRLLNQDDDCLIIDSGANKGEYTEELLKYYPNSNFVLFEPSEINYKYLVKKFENIESIVIENAGLSNKNDKVPLYFDNPGSRIASLSKRKLDHFDIEFSKSEEVKIIKLEDYWKENLENKIIDLLKLDIEGYELFALEGSEKILKYIRNVQFEFGGANIDSKTYFQDFWYFFSNFNFKIYRLSPLKLIEIQKYDESLEYFSTTNYIGVNQDLT
tara:strand:- start:3271 stop:4089 length:819 start_codon:yes stop_codon:yes gene_type:complete